MAVSQQSLPPVNQYTEIMLCDWPAFARAQALCMIRWFHHVRITTPCGVGRFRLCRPWSGRKTTGLDQGWQQRSTPCACITGRNSYLSSPCVMQTCVVLSIPGFRRIVNTSWPSPFGILASLARLIIQLISTTKSHWCRQGYSPVWRGDPSGTRRGRQPINS